MQIHIFTNAIKEMERKQRFLSSQILFAPKNINNKRSTLNFRF